MAQTKSNINIDKVLYVAGNSGRYLKVQSLLLVLNSFSSSFPMLSYVFIGYSPNHKCNQISNLTTFSNYEVEPDNMTNIKYRECTIDIQTNVSGRIVETQLPCVNGVHFDLPEDTSIVTEWMLVCDRAGLAELSQTLSMVGQGLGALIFTTLADKYGRRKLLLISNAIITCTSVALCFANDIMVFSIIRLVTGACQQGLALTSFTLLLELYTTEKRYIAGCIDGFAWSVSVVALAPIAYFMQPYGWRYFQLSTLIGLSNIILLFLFVDESLSWLVVNNKTQETEAVVKKMCKMNKTNFIQTMESLNEQTLLSKGVTEIGSEISESVLSKSNDADKANCILETNVKAEMYHYTILDIFRHCDVLKTTLILCFIWVVNNYTYFGLFFTASALSKDIHLNYFLNALAELPAMLPVYFALQRTGRRNVIIVFHVITGLSLITSSILWTTLGNTTAGFVTSTIFSLIGKCTITASFCSIYLMTPELFPTNIRSISMGVASSLSRLGGMVAPYSNFLGILGKWVPGVVFGVLCVMASFLMLLVPETKGRTLPVTIEEMKDWKSKDKETSFDS